MTEGKQEEKEVEQSYRGLGEVLGVPVPFSQGEGLLRIQCERPEVCSTVTMSGWSFLRFSSVSRDHRALERTNRDDSKEMPKLLPGDGDGI